MACRAVRDMKCTHQVVHMHPVHQGAADAHEKQPAVHCLHNTREVALLARAVDRSGPYDTCGKLIAVALPVNPTKSQCNARVMSLRPTSPRVQPSPPRSWKAHTGLSAALESKAHLRCPCESLGPQKRRYKWTGTAGHRQATSDMPQLHFACREYSLHDIARKAWRTHSCPTLPSAPHMRG